MGTLRPDGVEVDELDLWGHIRSHRYRRLYASSDLPPVVGISYDSDHEFIKPHGVVLGALDDNLVLDNMGNKAHCVRDSAEFDQISPDLDEVALSSEMLQDQATPSTTRVARLIGESNPIAEPETEEDGSTSVKVGEDQSAGLTVWDRYPICVDGREVKELRGRVVEPSAFDAFNETTLQLGGAHAVGDGDVLPGPGLCGEIRQ